jgi:hypothetical protein
LVCIFAPEISGAFSMFRETTPDYPQQAMRWERNAAKSSRE